MTTERTIRLDLEYEGTDFLGWQEQSRGRTVQGELRRALARFLQQDIQPIGSGRTDAGTHAKGLVAHLRTTSRHEPERFQRALNALLPPDVCVHRALVVADDFHARYSAHGKCYRYRLSEQRHPLQRRQVWVLPRQLDLEPMQEAAASLAGCHAFRAFCNQHPRPDHFDCTISGATWSRVAEECRFEICGNRFLRHMVRILVGTMTQIGEGKRSVADFQQLLNTPSDRPNAGPTAPSRGLCLLGVHYAEADGGPSGDLRSTSPD